ncbi:hypothetical protein PanWU01x14_363810 [Parasponia andersonii]|uniref:Uncharacterized protein n=1 Tax=Parasponia andersonii TaxID=3476 RepID=A0A2P5A6I3_PARAD|nr:hypothetical protein PanWU01x14_363810 [Parasponia andersonii]
MARIIMVEYGENPRSETPQSLISGSKVPALAEKYWRLQSEDQKIWGSISEFGLVNVHPVVFLCRGENVRFSVGHM